MSRIAVIGASPRVDGYALAGALVCPTDDPSAIAVTWDELPSDVEVVVLTPEAAAQLGDRVHERMAVVLP